MAKKTPKKPAKKAKKAPAAKKAEPQAEIPQGMKAPTVVATGPAGLERR